MSGPAAETLQAWRQEILAEVTALEEELAQASADLAAAQGEYADAQESWQQLNNLAASGLLALENTPEPLFGRLEVAHRELLDPLSRARGRAMAAVKTLEGRIGGRRLAVSQIERALTADKVVSMNPRPGPPRRKAQVIEFDNITHNIAPAPAVGGS